MGHGLIECLTNDLSHFVVEPGFVEQGNTFAQVSRAFDGGGIVTAREDNA